MHWNTFFPLNRLVNRQDIMSLVLVIAIYLAVCAAIRVAEFLLGWTPLIGWIIRVIGWIVGAYCAVGIILAIVSSCNRRD